MHDVSARSAAPAGWHESADGTVYPPEPWYLGGSLLLAVFRVPVGEVPLLDEALPAGHRPVVLGGDTVVGLAVVGYAPGGVLAYDELLTALPTRCGAALRVTIPQIWVTSPQSRAGGRELWGIPKEIAQVRREAASSGAVRTEVRTVAGEPVVRLTSRVGGRVLPGRVPVPLPTAQRLDGRTVVSHNRVVARVHRLAARWEVAAGGPLGHLAGREPVAQVVLTDASVVFGERVVRA
ncbi:acetoacetate decarboxylase family protein [Cellulomonas sp. P22]|uniref:acetoacetate decarboxylase family protein n=1 Tax=Cellulomonas sp. P22 TaxID=3373189 RepID=UPI00379F9E42